MVSVPSFPLVLQEKRLLGCLYGSAQVRRDFPRLVGLVEQNKLDLGSMVSRRIKLDEMNPNLNQVKGPAREWVEKSMALNLDEGDAADEDTLNRILWHAMKGFDVPYPVQHTRQKEE